MAIQEEEEVHVLLVSLAMQGHINPMFMFANVLISKRLHVTLAITETKRDLFHNESVSTAGSKLYVDFFSDGFDESFERLSEKNADHYFKSLPMYGSRNLSNLIDKLSSVRKFSYIVNNPYVPWVVDVAEQHGIPCATLWIQPCALYSIFYRFCKDLSAFPTMENLDKPIVLPALPLLYVNDIPEIIHPSNPFPGIQKAFADTIQNLDKVKWLLGNSFYELEKEIVDSMKELSPITPIGPLVPPSMVGKDEILQGGVDMWKPEDSVFDWLDKRPPASVVYISFGSVVMLSSKQIENIALALKNTKQPFIWVVKPNKEKDGMGVIPTWFIEETREQGIVVPWCTQTRVLAHSSVACFISHCGWNSLLEGIVSGVPMIGFPKWSDQPANSKLLTHVFKSGVILGRVDDVKVVSEEEVEQCILEIMEGPKAEEIKNQATKLKTAARMAVSDDGSSSKNLELFIDDVRRSSPNKGI